KVFVQAVIGTAVLGEVVGTDALVAIARADHGLACRVALGPLHFLIVCLHPAGHDPAGLGTVLVLAALVAHRDRQPRGDVLELARGANLIAVLPARAAGR